MAEVMSRGNTDVIHFQGLPPAYRPDAPGMRPVGEQLRRLPLVRPQVIVRPRSVGFLRRGPRPNDHGHTPDELYRGRGSAAAQWMKARSSGFCRDCVEKLVLCNSRRPFPVPASGGPSRSTSTRRAFPRQVEVTATSGVMWHNAGFTGFHLGDNS